MGLISALLLVPACAALLLALIPFSVKWAKVVGSLASLLVLSLAVTILWYFDSTSADFQFVEKAAWIAEFGISYEVGIDGISLFLVLLTGISGVAVIFSTRDHDRLRGFLSLFLFLQLSLIGVFVTLDLILFYVFFELMLVPTYLLMNGWGESDRARASIRFVLYTAIGSVLMLCSIIYLGWLNADQVGDPSFSLIDLSQSLRLDPSIEALLFIGFFVAFAIKTPVVPFHNWVPSAYAEAPYSITAFMSAVMAKAGLYGFVRFVWPLFPVAFISFRPTLIWILAIGVVYTALIAWAQRDAKRMLAYSSVSHLGICALGVVVCSTLSVSAAVFFMFAHGVVALGLFLTLGAIVSRSKTSEIAEMGGLVASLPKLSIIFFLFLLGAVALPLTGNFVAEFAILLAAFSSYPYQTALASISIVLGAVYMLAFFRRSFFKTAELKGEVTDLTYSEFAILAPLALLMFVLGVMPQPMLTRIESSAQRLEGFVRDATSAMQHSLDFGAQEGEGKEDLFPQSSRVLKESI